MRIFLFQLLTTVSAFPGGGSQEQPPNIDRLANEGTRFLNPSAASPHAEAPARR